MNNSSDLLDMERFLVFGAGVSGLAAAAFLARHGKQVAVYDEGDLEALESKREKLEALQIPLLHPDQVEIVAAFDGLHTTPTGGRQSENWEALILSPGVPPTHELVELATHCGCVVRSEIELGYQACPAPIIGITGTNGKTTVTHMVSHMLTRAGWYAPIGGNVGVPLCNVVEDVKLKDPKSVVVCEISSFQLETIEYFRPKIACVLNVTPDHLDRYGSMDQYVAAKQWITANQKMDDVLVLNEDCVLCRSYVARSMAQVRKFSLTRRVTSGACLVEGFICALCDEGAEPERVLPVSDFPLPGRHNIENALAAVSICAAAGMAPEAMGPALRDFQSVPHRIEWIARLEGVDYYNDSKATNLGAMEKALESFDRPVVLIAGGRDKGSPWSALNGLVAQKVKSLVLLGEAAPIGRKAWASLVGNTLDADSMRHAVDLARKEATEGDVVLLSPGCASFDMYKSFAERGDDFRSIVQSLS